MNYKKLFSKYRRRLKLEAFVKALVGGFAAGYFAVAVVSVLSKFIITDNPTLKAIRECDIMTLLLYGLYVSLAFAVLAYFIYRPSLKETARRVDETGLNDRSATMLALKDDGSYIASVQRENAIEKLKLLKPSGIGFRDNEILPVFGAAALSVILAVALHSGIGYDPLHTIVAAEPVPEQIVVESRVISDLLVQLRDDVRVADVPDGIRAELNEMIDRLELEVHDYDTTLQKAAKISEARLKIMEIIERESADLSVADAMIENELTKALGEAIKTGDERKIAEAMQALNLLLFDKDEDELKSWLTDMAAAFSSALEASGGVDENAPDPIKQAIDGLAQAFSNAAEQANENADEARTTAGVPMFDAAQDIADSINGQGTVGNELKRILDTLDKARSVLFGIEEQNTADPEENSGVISDDPASETEDPEYVVPPGGGGGETDPGGGADDPESGAGFFDPTQIDNFGSDYVLTDEDFMRDLYQQIVKSGEVKNPDTFLDYYAAALEDIARNDIPDKLREVIIKYFTSLD